jgi:prolyl-tRNA synthetase
MLFSSLARRWRTPSAHAVLLRRCAGSTPAAPPAAAAPPAPAAPPARHHRGWYAAALAAGDLTDARTPVRGCAILKPRGYALWEHIRADLDARIRGLGAQNVSVPLLVPASFLQREAAHVAGFAAECAVVTHHRLVSDGKAPGSFVPDPTAALAEPLVVRPTSEAIVWDAFSRWVHSHRDLPFW